MRQRTFNTSGNGYG